MERPEKCFQSWHLSHVCSLSLDKSLSLTMSVSFFIKWSQSLVPPTLPWEAQVLWWDQWQPLHRVRRFRLKNVPLPLGSSSPGDVWNTQMYMCGWLLWLTHLILRVHCWLLGDSRLLNTEKATKDQCGRAFSADQPSSTCIPLLFKDGNQGSESRREQKRTIEQVSGRGSHGNGHIPQLLSRSQADAKGKLLLRQHEMREGTTLGLFTALSQHRFQHENVEYVNPENEQCCVCLGLGALTSDGLCLRSTPHFPGLFHWARQAADLSAEVCLAVKQGHFGTYLVRISWGLNEIIYVKHHSA